MIFLNILGIVFFSIMLLIFCGVLIFGLFEGRWKDSWAPGLFIFGFVLCLKFLISDTKRLAAKDRNPRGADAKSKD
tara:strand:+ start:832 stop:1059 length:228 start_codon:yes stop_codon:yes gene_type:complete